MCIRYRRVLSLRLIIAPITSCASLCVRIRSRRLSEFQLYEAVSSAAGPTLSIRSADRVPLSPGVRALYQPLSAPRPRALAAAVGAVRTSATYVPRCPGVAPPRAL